MYKKYMLSKVIWQTKYKLNFKVRSFIKYYNYYIKTTLSIQKVSEKSANIINLNNFNDPGCYTSTKQLEVCI